MDVVGVHAEAEVAKVDRVRRGQLVRLGHRSEAAERPGRPAGVARPDGLPDRLQIDKGDGHALDVDPVPGAVPLAAVRPGLAPVELLLLGPLVVGELLVEVIGQVLG